MAVVGTSTFTPSTTGTAVSTVMPAGIAAGQIAYYAVGTNSGTATLTTPSGWTLVEGPVRAGSALSGWLFAKVLTGSEGGTTITATLSASGRRHGIITVVSTSASSFDTKTMWNDTSADTTLSVPAYTPGVANAQVVAITLSRYGTTNGTVTYPAGYTEHAEAITGYAVPNFAVAVASENLTGGPSAQPAENGTYTQVASTIGWVLTFAPAASSANQGTSAVTLPGLASAAAAAVILAGTVTASLPALSSSATGDSTAAATSASTLPPLSSAASGVAVNAGSSAASLPALSSASTGTSRTAGSVDSSLPPLTSATAGTSRASGTSSATLPALTSAATGAGSNPTTTGTSASTLPALTSTSVAAAVARGTSAATLPALVTTAAGSAKDAATHVVTLPALTSAAAGDLTASGAVAVVLPGLTSASSATTGEAPAAPDITVGAPQPARFAAAPPLPHPLTVATPAATVKAGNPLPPRYRRTDDALRR